MRNNVCAAIVVINLKNSMLFTCWTDMLHCCAAVADSQIKTNDLFLNFYTNIHRIDRNKSPLKNFGNSSRGRSQELPKIFGALIYWVHRAVIFAIAQLSCTIVLPSHN